MERTASCACGRLTVTLEGDPTLVLACHCDFCLRRSGSAYPVMAYFDKNQITATTGETSIFNGTEQNGQPGPGGLTNLYNFCPTCGSTVFWTFTDIPNGVFPEDFEQMLPEAIVLAAGAFADPDFPPPSIHFFDELRPAWLQIHEPQT